MSGAVKAVLALVAGVILTFAVVSYTGGGTGDAGPGSVGDGGTTTSSATSSGPARDESSDPPDTAWSAAIPAHVLDTLALIDAGDWPDAADAPGTRGGDRFGNRERLLPRAAADGSPVAYREWDVNPKPRGGGRDAERIVTGSDGSAWYTADHYSSFVRIR
ncbi:ribonuclease domain-containing protein [Dietzia sp. UBA5065]|jgi:guanyl-specific ribonuclease Sa|uniref:ribonuclease domain-containing protein n=1 Tax=Dietzia sp. UBA5065 TaxID=1946422 RepID=UPI0025C61A83|nr:ribonuclease domain-containing protein [Dietzia sp. UBA5065]